MAVITRPLTREDFDEALRLGFEGFGTPPPGSAAPDPTRWPGAGRHRWGSFDGDTMAARMDARQFHSWFGGVQVPTCGIAGVATNAEHRGQGLLDGLFREVLDEARGRGEVISTLFPTAPGIYRRFGYELVGSYDTVDVPVTSAAGVRPATGITTGRATAADVEAVQEVYDTWAAAQNGPLTRRGPSFDHVTAEELLADFSGVTLALDAEGRVLGYASWERGQGYDGSAAIEVSDLIGLTADACRALWRVLGSFAGVVATVRVETSGADLSRLVLPALPWKVVNTHPYMLRLLDVPGALAVRRFEGEADISFAVVGDVLGLVDGGYHLRVSGGETSCSAIEATIGMPTFTPHGIALAWAGAQSCSNLRMAGHLSRGDASSDAVFDRLFGGWQLHIRDYF